MRRCIWHFCGHVDVVPGSCEKCGRLSWYCGDHIAGVCGYCLYPKVHEVVIEPPKPPERTDFSEFWVPQYREKRHVG